MLGILYAEWVRYRKWFWIGGAVILLYSVMSFMVFGQWLDPILLQNRGTEYCYEEMFLSEYLSVANSICMSMCLVYFVVTSILALQSIKADERKAWAHFVISTPQCAKSLIDAKYTYTLLLGVAMCVLSYLFETVFSAWYCMPVNVTALYMLLFFVQLLIFAICMPFDVRFGSKLGANVRLILFVAMAFLALVYFLFGDLAIFDDAELFGEKLYNSLLGEGQSKTVTIVMAVLPYLSMAAYGLSYLYSCKAYVKGVAYFDN